MRLLIDLAHLQSYLQKLDPTACLSYLRFTSQSHSYRDSRNLPIKLRVNICMTKMRTIPGDHFMAFVMSQGLVNRWDRRK